jgi:hypothetical protein
MTKDRPSSAHQARASVEVDAPPGHLCVNEVLLHAGDGYWARRGSAGAANDHPSIGGAALSADPDDVENADQPDRLVDVERQDPTTGTEHTLAEGRVITRRQHNHLPRHVGKVRSSFDQRIMSILR